jgi:hypothetical protein
MGCVDHPRVRFAAVIGSFQEHPGKDAFLAASLPTAVEHPRRTVFSRRISPP